MKSEPDYTVRQAAEFFSLHPETIRKMTRAGNFPNAYKLNGRTSPTRIPWTDIEAFRQIQPRVSR